jgi:hypothetical protein
MVRSDATRPSCSFAKEFEGIASESVLKHITDQTTPHQYQQAIASLTTLKETMEKRMDWRHYGAASGGMHRCLPETCEAVVFYLQSRMLLVVPKPEPPPPAPRPQRRSLADVLKQFAEEGEER